MSARQDIVSDRVPARYDAARRALAEAHRVDEVKTIRDKAAAMAEYARQAKDGEMIGWATEIKIRAERRAGEMLREMRDNGERDPGGRGKIELRHATQLKDLGVSNTQSSRWQKLASLPDDDFEARTAAAKREAVASVESPRAERVAEKRQHRAERERELAAKIIALPDRKFGVIYADPAWRWEAYSSETGLDRGPSSHYPTMTVEAIKALDLAGIAADDCALFLWAVAPMLPEALDVITAWGFVYKTGLVWAKDRVGMGYWVRSRHEHLLLATRGEPPAPAMGTQWPSLIEAPVGRHSEKPAIFREIIETLFPTMPKLEMFARGKASAGWDIWGNEAEGGA